ncbi:hypothetical protein [Paenibacillus sp. FSL R5-0923]|uniref:hypothetical protein n=1 Tax=Paenibacillus sp. FSL R5-0923 TaxID=2921666 RepID=UPI0030F963A6
MLRTDGTRFTALRPPAAYRRREWLAKLVASLAKEGARLRPKRQEQLTKLVPVCCANAEPASLAKEGARLRQKRQEQLAKLVPVCCANAGPACFAKGGAWRSSCTEVLRSVCKARTAACSRGNPVVGGSYGEEVWNCRSVSVRLYVWISTAMSGLNQEIQT